MPFPTITLLGVLASAPAVEAPPPLPPADRVRIAEAFRLADALGNQVWPGWDRAPFAVLLVTPDHEFLVRHPRLSEEFTPLGEDAHLKHKVYWRKRVFSPKLLATFPAVGGVPTIVIGQAEATEAKTSTRWVITLLHEHFHQLQNSQPRYYAEVDALGLARGDQTGMWMLNFPFPYTDPTVRDQFTTLGKSLLEALKAEKPSDFASRFASYVEARKKFQSLLKEDDARYLAFQVWQEGIARYTEIHLAERAAQGYTPSQEFQALKDYKPFGEVARSLRDSLEEELAASELDRSRRGVVYNFGAAEGLVLDRARPGWRKRYFEERFSLDKHFLSK